MAESKSRMSLGYLDIPTSHGTIKGHKIVPQRLRVQTEETEISVGQRLYSFHTKRKDWGTMNMLKIYEFMSLPPSTHPHTPLKEAKLLFWKLGNKEKGKIIAQPFSCRIILKLLLKDHQIVYELNFFF